MNNSTVIAPYFFGAEGWDVAVDKNDQLHIACLINESASSHVDSAWANFTYSSEAYKWPHTPGKRPYLYDFIFDSNNNWQYGIVDSLSTEAPGIWGLDPGNAYNPWGPNNVPSNARIQLSRTPDGKYILFTWTETDTVATNGLNWNSNPDIKARLLDADNLSLSPAKINISQGPNTDVSGRATLNFVSPRSGTATVLAGSVDIKLPVTISNNPAFSPSSDCSHWYTSAQLSFSTTGMIPITSTIASVGLAEHKNFSVSWAQLYPNPVNDSFSLSLDRKITEAASIEILNNLGQIVYLAKQDAQNAKHNVSHLSPGVYFVCIGSGSKTANFKLIKE